VGGADSASSPPLRGRTGRMSNCIGAGDITEEYAQSHKIREALQSIPKQCSTGLSCFRLPFSSRPVQQTARPGWRRHLRSPGDGRT
jgi:hypothetical protein